MKNFRQSDLIVAGALVLVLSVLVLPIPTPALDLMLVMSVAIGALVLFLTLHIHNPLELSTFPSLLLLVTLFRLSLNVATTRQILLHAFAGRVIQSFGDFVVGGNYIVGIVVFLILVIINFMVITKGSGRIAEVTARFTLDSMPGKQMSIDADLGAGLIDEKEALRRRDELSNEADFYGAMDGASKFVRGDATAGLVITAINIVGGFMVGMLQQGMSAGEAIRTYTILTVGDGLVTQIPALIISTSAGMLVTRAASEQSMGEDLKNQLFLHSKPLLTTGGMLWAMALVPGLPVFPFMLMGSVMGGVGYVIQRRAADAAPEEGMSAASGTGSGERSLTGAAAKGLPTPRETQVPEVSAMEVEIGFGLVPLVDRGQGGPLLDRITTIRQQLAEELGIILPPVNVHDNVRLRNSEYTLRVRGLEVATGTLQPGNFMAIDSDGGARLEGGVEVKEPTFGFRAWWITPAQRDAAEAKGLTVVDAAGVLITHLSETARRHAADLLSRQDVSDMLDRVKQKHASVVQELIPQRLSVGIVHRVLQHLLSERVSIRNLASILEVLSDHAAQTQDSAILGELCRRTRGGHITAAYLEAGSRLPAIALHPQLEALLKESLQRESGELGALALAPEKTRALLDSLEGILNTASKKKRQPVVVCLPVLRRHLRRLLESQWRDLAVLSFAEIPDSVEIDIIGLINIPDENARKDVA